MLALLLRQPMLNLDAEEATQLAKAVKEVLKYHKVNVSPQAMAYMQLAACAATIYGPKVAVIVMQQNAQRRQQAARQPVAAVTPEASAAEFGPVVTHPGTMRFQ